MSFITEYEIIDAVENRWIEQCNNGGLMYCSQGTYDSYGYDFVSRYPSILANKYFKLPKYRGKQLIKKKLEQKDIQLGYYRCIITSDNPHFSKIFAYSKNITYTHHTLNFLRKHQQEFNISIELIQDGQPNAMFILTDKTKLDVVLIYHITDMANKSKYRVEFQTMNSGLIPKGYAPFQLAAGRRRKKKNTKNFE
jgi:hypothetical protein